MPYRITGTLNGRTKVRTRKTLGEAAAKARSMQIDAIREVRVFQDDGHEVDPGNIAAITLHAEHLRRVRNLRRWGWSFITMPPVMLLPISLPLIIQPVLILEYWDSVLLWFGLPALIGFLFLDHARKLARAGSNPPAAAPPSPPAPPAANSPPAPWPRSRPGR